MNRLFIILSSIFCFMFSINVVNAELLKDEFMEQHLKTIEIKEPITNKNYNYTSVEKIPIKLQITKKITSKKGALYDNMPVDFVVKEDVFFNNKEILKRGDKVTARVSTSMTRGMNGIPGVIILEDFDIKGISPEQLKDIYIEKGMSLALLVFPIKWALTPLPPTGSLTNFIIGGNAVISKRDKVIVYYYPEWDIDN